MSSEINLRTFIKSATNSSENRISISKNGRIKVFDRSNGRTFNCFPFFHKRANDSKFTFDVLNGVIELLTKGELETPVSKKVSRASKAIFEQFSEEWEDLSEEEKLSFFELPKTVSIDAIEHREVQLETQLGMLNGEFGLAIASDLDRAIANKSLWISISSEPAFKPKLKNPESIKALAEILADAAKLSDNTKAYFVQGVTEHHTDRNFERVLGKIPSMEPEHVEELSGLRRFLKGVSQFQILNASHLLKNLLGESSKLKLVDGSHDKVLIQLNNNGTIEVTHYFQLYLQSNQAKFNVKTISLFDTATQEWVDTSMQFQADDIKNTSKEVKKMNRRLKKLGY